MRGNKKSGPPSRLKSARDEKATSGVRSLPEIKVYVPKDCMYIDTKGASLIGIMFIVNWFYPLK